MGFFVGEKKMKAVNSPLFGVGINDASYKTRITMNSVGRQVTLWTCPYYECWKSMLRRCFSDYSRRVHPSYEGSTVCNDWIVFSEFRRWMYQQDWEDKSLDKDIIIPGNKEYSAESCVFIHQSLNVFISDRRSCKGDWPTGVYFKSKTGKFVAQCSNPWTGKRDHLGYFNCPQKAHYAWRDAKHQHALRYADMQDDPRVAAALRVRYLNYQDSAGRY